MGRAQSLVANGCLFPGPFFPSPQHYSARVGVYFGCLVFFFKKKKKIKNCVCVCVCVYFIFILFFFLICTPWKMGCSDPRPWKGEHRAPLPTRRRERWFSGGRERGWGAGSNTLQEQTLLKGGPGKEKKKKIKRKEQRNAAYLRWRGLWPLNSYILQSRHAMLSVFLLALGRFVCGP